MGILPAYPNVFSFFMFNHLKYNTITLLCSFFKEMYILNLPLAFKMELMGFEQRAIDRFPRGMNRFPRGMRCLVHAQTEDVP
jgi:hypothetical protein